MSKNSEVHFAGLLQRLRHPTLLTMQHTNKINELKTHKRKHAYAEQTGR